MTLPTIAYIIFATIASLAVIVVLLQHLRCEPKKQERVL